MRKRMIYSSIIFAVLLIIALIIMKKTSQDNLVNKLNLFGIVAVFEIFYVLASLKTVGPKEKGLLLYFEKPFENVESGLTYVPLGIFSLRTETRLIIQRELPAEPSKIWKINDENADQNIPAGYFPPIRITFGPPKEVAEDHIDFVGKDNPYDIQMTTEVTPVISFRITNFKQFVTTIGTIEEACRQIEDVAVAQFSADFATITPAVALKHINVHSGKLKQNIEDLISIPDQEWGIEIISTQIKPFGFSRGLNTSVIRVAEAKQNYKTTIINADARAKEIDTVGTAQIAITKRTLIETGQAKVDDNGNVKKLVPDAKTKVVAKAIGKLKGTLVINGNNEVANVLNLNSK